MRTWLIVLVVVAQIAVLGYMAGEREMIVRTGRAVFLRTAPVDPRDPMRGDYVAFDYEIAHVPQSLCRDGAAAWFNAKRQRHEPDAIRDRVVYVEIHLDDSGIAELQSATDREPTTGSYLRARVVGVNGGQLDVRFGAESLYMQQGKAAEFAQAATAKAGVPMDVELAVSRRGVAVLKSFRWEPLGITIEPDRVPRTAGTPSGGRGELRRGLRGITVELKNHGDKPIAIVALPEGQSFRLLRNERWRENDYEWMGEHAPIPTPQPIMVRVLAPGATYREHIDLTTPRWFVRDTKKPAQAPLPLESLADGWNASFRLEYAPPSAVNCTGLPNVGLILHSRVRSRAFAAGGGVD